MSGDGGSWFPGVPFVTVQFNRTGNTRMKKIRGAIVSPFLSASSVLCLFALMGSGCSPRPGPDKPYISSAQGAAGGAVSGALTGAQVSAGTGPGAIVGAGLGAAFGAISGIAAEQIDEAALKQQKETEEERSRAIAQAIIQESLERQVEIHPSREIYPADVFFGGDGFVLTEQGQAVVKELARLNKNRLAYSRLGVTAYVMSKDGSESSYSQELGARRAEAFTNAMVRAGLEPRRIVPRVVIVDQPLVRDPLDDRRRFNQAIELSPLDLWQ